MTSQNVSGKISFKSRNCGIPVIEFHMLDKQKYFPLAALSGVTVRTILYPFSLIKTRLQVQKHSKLYLGTFDALRHIVKSDGLRGLYYGFCVNNLAMVSQMTFLTTYEAIRQRLTESQVLLSSRQRAFVAGGCASFVAQTIVVPIDVISQHLQMLPVSARHGHLLKLNICDAPGEQFTTRIGAARSVISGIYNQHGLGGFYKGYTMSVAMFAPTSAVWWFSYDLYCDTISTIVPVWFPRLALQCSSALMSATTVTLITTPLDAIRARMQVENTEFLVTAKNLWSEERLRIFAKGLSARLIQSNMASFFVILGYETIKKWSLLDEYKTSINW